MNMASLVLACYVFGFRIFTPQPLRAVGYCFHSWCPDGQAGGQAAGKVCLGCISETVRCRKLILGRNIVSSYYFVIFFSKNFVLILLGECLSETFCLL